LEWQWSQFWLRLPRATDSSNHAHLSAHEIGRHLRQPIVSVLCPSVFDLDVPALDVAALAQALPKCSQHARLRLGRDTT